MRSQCLAKSFVFKDFVEGFEYILPSFEITRKMVDSFAKLSGDYSPIHMDGSFSKKKGFEGRVVHGVFFATILSKIVGMDFPGKNALLQSISLTFIEPAYIGDKIEVQTKVFQVSHSTSTIVLKSTISNIKTGNLICRAKIQVGITEDE